MNLTDKYLVITEKLNLDMKKECTNCKFGDTEIDTEETLEGAFAKTIEKLDEKGTLSSRIFKRIDVEVIEKDIDQCKQELPTATSAGAAEEN